jgi:tetratricopeptide (TPR) repeat protein
MSSNQHYDDERIIGFLDRLEVARQDPHLASCRRCSGMLDEYRLVEKTLGQAPVWDLRELKDEPVPATIANLRAFAGTMAREDAEADANLTRLLEGPREWWSNRLRQNPQWRTAGMVRRLIAATDRAIDTMPPDAVEITALAVDIAEGLDPAGYPSDTVAKLRGAAWRERGFALYYTGNYPAALKATEAAEGHFRKATVSEYDLARTATLRALVYRPMDRVPEALSLTEESASTFGLFGDKQRLASARFMRAHLMLKVHDYRGALLQLRAIQSEFDDVMTDDTRARVTMNIAFCLRELNEVTEALQEYRIAAEMFDALETPTESARIRWNVAGLLAAQGNTKEAHRRLIEVLPELEKLGMKATAALVRLEVAEILLVDRHFDEVERLCHDAISSFEASGLAYTSRALTALAYLREAASEATATPRLAREVHMYIRSLPEQPNLLFVQAPS